MYSKDSTSFDIFNFLKMSWLFLILCSYKEGCNDLSQCLLLTREALSRLYKPGRIAFIPRSSQVLLQLDVWLTLLPKLPFCKTWPYDFPAWNLQLAPPSPGNKLQSSGTYTRSLLIWALPTSPGSSPTSPTLSSLVLLNCLQFSVSKLLF